MKIKANNPKYNRVNWNYEKCLRLNVRNNTERIA